MNHATSNTVTKNHLKDARGNRMGDRAGEICESNWALIDGAEGGIENSIARDRERMLQG